MFPFANSEAEMLAWLKEEAAQLRRDNERALKERGWLLTALQARIDECPCTIGDCRHCVGNERLIKQVLR